MCHQPAVMLSCREQGISSYAIKADGVCSITPNDSLAAAHAAVVTSLHITDNASGTEFVHEQYLCDPRQRARGSSQQHAQRLAHLEQGAQLGAPEQYLCPHRQHVRGSLQQHAQDLAGLEQGVQHGAPVGSRSMAKEQCVGEPCGVHAPVETLQGGSCSSFGATTTTAVQAVVLVVAFMYLHLRQKCQQHTPQTASGDVFPVSVLGQLPLCPMSLCLLIWPPHVAGLQLSCVLPSSILWRPHSQQPRVSLPAYSVLRMNE